MKNMLERGIVKLLLVVVIGLTMNSYAESCTDSDDQFLITFHPHMDAFWLNTDNELKDINFRPAGFLYNMNQRNSKTIFNSMVASLKPSPNRKYFVTEVFFFRDWYEYTTPENKQKVKQFLKNGQLEIANGGWVQNDEAVTYYDDVLDQYTVGMNYLYQQFSYQVKTGWATDSFGHSHSQAALLHLLGVQFQGIQRVDDRFVNLRIGGPLLEFYWDAVSDSNNISYGGVLNHVRHFLHEVNDLRYPQVQTVKQDFKSIHHAMKNNYFKKNKLFRFLGNDFQEFIPEEFTKLEQVMGHLNKDFKKQMCPTFKYGNPYDYLQLLAKYYQKNPLPTRKYDLMPNWDQDRYWTGYYTTDPALKKICKDFSRIVNFCRKSLLVSNMYGQNAKNLLQADELLAIMQHHDGITATSKTYIQDEFKNRMIKHTTDIVKKLKQLHGVSNSITCKFHQNHNECQISDQDAAGGAFKYLNILTHGGSKKQKIELIVPNGIYYDIAQVDQDIFCEANGKCAIVFEASLHPGVNKFSLASKTKEQMASQIFQMQVIQGKAYNGRDFTISADSDSKNSVRYEYGDGEYFDIGLFISSNQGSSRQTMAWNKYGSRMDKTEYVNAGMYIMSNTGKIQPVQQKFNQFKFAEGKIYKRAVLTSSISKLKLTIKNDQPNIIDVINTFRPETRSMVDYFMRVSSSVKSDTLYHDSNGFLVAKKLLNQRPDYEFIPKPEDLINGNTYPVCSFAYFIQNDKKFLFFTDRANGVASYEKNLLINFDRLAGDDSKGVGQGYTRQINNTFRYKFALVSARDDIQRVWQREYDEALIGFLDKQDENVYYRKGSTNQISHVPGNGPISNLKYSIYHLNQNQYMIRLQNLAQFSNIVFNKYKQQGDEYRWVIQQLGIDLNFKDVKQSYANGIVKEQGPNKWRRFWGKEKENMITVLNQGKLDSEDSKLTLRPLQIRSFRINKAGKVVAKKIQFSVQKKNPVLQELNNVGNLRSFRTRCF